MTEPLAWCPGLEREVVFTVYSSLLASTCSSTYYTAALSNEHSTDRHVILEPAHTGPRLAASLAREVHTSLALT